MEKIQVRKLEATATVPWPFFDWSLLWGILSFWVGWGFGPYLQEAVIAINLLPSWLGMAFRWLIYFA